MPRTAYKDLDREHPDPWVVWDEDEQAWRMARLILNERRPTPILIDDLGRRHEVGNETRCQSLESLYKEGDMTQVKHKFAIDETAWAPTLADGDHLGSGFQLRSWRNVR